MDYAERREKERHRLNEAVKDRFRIASYAHKRICLICTVLEDGCDIGRILSRCAEYGVEQPTIGGR